MEKRKRRSFTKAYKAEVVDGAAHDVRILDDHKG